MNERQSPVRKFYRSSAAAAFAARAATGTQVALELGVLVKGGIAAICLRF
jgi:hypothetical protein